MCSTLCVVLDLPGVDHVEARAQGASCRGIAAVAASLRLDAAPDPAWTSSLDVLVVSRCHERRA